MGPIEMCSYRIPLFFKFGGLPCLDDPTSMWAASWPDMYKQIKYMNMPNYVNI